MSLLLDETLIGAAAAVTPPAAVSPFISTWHTTAANETITLPLSGGVGSDYNFAVDWGDGTTEQITSATDLKRIHTYAAAGTHKITITGTLVGWAFNNAGDKVKIFSVDQWGALRFIPTQRGHFWGCTKLTIPATDAPAMSASCAGMFHGCSALALIPAAAKWDLSVVTDMSFMFSGCSVFNQDVSGWDISNATTIFGIFQYCGQFNQPLNTWKTAKCTQMGFVFLFAPKFNHPLNLWDTSSCVNMESMFDSATAFDQDISGWDVSKVTSMNSMFQAAAAFNHPLGNWNTVSNTNIRAMFSRANKFNQDISRWNTTNVTNTFGTFMSAPAFNCGQPAGTVHTLMDRTASGGWRIGGTPSSQMQYMFYGASSFAGDISHWCADAATTAPASFGASAHPNFTVARQPKWGQCPIPD